MLNTIDSLRPKTLFLLGSIFCFLALTFALFSQYVLGLEPCTFCIAQRICYTLLFITFTSGYVHAQTHRPDVPAGTSSRAPLLYTSLNLSSATISSLLSGFGFFLALYQYFIAKHSRECGISFAQKLINWTHLEQLFPWMFEVKALCADAPATLLGIAYELYSAAGFLGLFIVSLLLIFKTIRPQKPFAMVSS